MHKIGALIFPGFELLDLFGPLEMFGLLKDDFSIELVAKAAGPVVSNQQVSAHADWDLANAPAFDILLVPGGSGARRVATDTAQLGWIAARGAEATLTLSVCTGALLLGKAGVLEGRKATTNKAAFNWVADQVPGANWVAQARWVEDGPVLTSSGVSAGMDMSLRVIERLHGPEKAEQVALWAEYTWHRDPDRDPFAQAHGLT